MNSIVVADAGPLHYLILIDCADLLEILFDRVLIPEAVRDELLNAAAPGKVGAWIGVKKPWLSVESVAQPQSIRGLHRGEAEALQLALNVRAVAVLMDDMDGRFAARRLGIAVVGTVGLLERLAELELIRLPEAFDKLRQTNFFASPELLKAALQRDQMRRNK